MQIQKFGEITYYRTERSEDDLGVYVDWLVTFFVRRRKLFREIAERYSAKHNLHGYAILEAHGGAKNGNWYFYDGQRKHVLQHWIDKIDGDVLAILVYSCNVRNVELRSQQSILVHSTRKFNHIQLIGRRVPLRIYVPPAGYLDTQYQLRKTLDDLVGSD